ncbi:hypothetical protein V6N12_051821 [Hibiscus sabdariffa]|uniref:Secreted protein n=1 Tax=Hibiscus sabdariffa TaxID=183260 RepID=A0ABR2GIA5_9ROSI
MRVCNDVLIVFVLLISTTQVNYLGLVIRFLAPHNAAHATIGMPPSVWNLRLERYSGYAQWYH